MILTQAKALSGSQEAKAELERQLKHAQNTITETTTQMGKVKSFNRKSENCEIFFIIEKWLDKILICICICFMQSQAKLESEIAKLKEENEKTKDEGNSLQEKLLMQVQIGQFSEVNR